MSSNLVTGASAYSAPVEAGARHRAASPWDSQQGVPLAVSSASEEEAGDIHIRKAPGIMVWQRNYYKHIIRTERATKAIQKYIINNPARWHLDTYNAQASGPDPMAAELWRLLDGGDP